MLNVRQVKYGNTITVALAGELVAEHVDGAERAFRWTVEDAETLHGLSTVVVVELGEITAVDEAGVQALTVLAAAVRSVPARLFLTGARPAVVAVFAALRVADAFTFEDESGVARGEGP